MKTFFLIIAIVFFGLQGCTQNAPKSSKIESKTANTKYKSAHFGRSCGNSP